MGSEEEAKSPVARKYGSIQLPPGVRRRNYKYAPCPLEVIMDTDVWHSLARGEWKFPRPPRRAGAVYDEVDYGDVWKQLSNRTLDVARGDVAETLEWVLDLPENVRRLMRKVLFKLSSMGLSRLSPRTSQGSSRSLTFSKWAPQTSPSPNDMKCSTPSNCKRSRMVWQEKLRVPGTLGSS